MIDSLTTTWSRPYKIVRVLQALGMDVPLRLRRERLALLVDALKKNGIEAVLADYNPLDLDDSPGIEAKIRLRRAASYAPPRTVFGLEVVRDLPSGGMSACYIVKGPDGANRFLKKVAAAGSDAAALKREQEIYSKLDRAGAEHVVRVLELLQDGDSVGLLMELADGGTLDEHIEATGSLPAAAAKPIALEVLAGLCQLHVLDIVHRDLKPKNVLRFAAQWKLSDFGISKNLSRLITRGPTFQRSGSAGYAAPEQWRGVEAHPSADVYSFGKVIVFLLTGQTDVDWIIDEPRWADLVRKCTHIDPNERPSLATVRDDLERL